MPLLLIQDMFCLQPSCQLSGLQDVIDTTLNYFTLVLGLRGFGAGAGPGAGGHIVKSHLTKNTLNS